VHFVPPSIPRVLPVPMRLLVLFVGLAQRSSLIRVVATIAKILIMSV
jgi:hypothetical protein